MENLEKLIKDLQRAGVNTKAFEAELAKVKAGLADGGKLAETMKTTLAGVTAAAKGLNTEFTSIRQNLAANLAEIAKTNSAINEGRKAYKGIVSIAAELANEEAGIASLNQNQLSKLHQRAQIRLQEVKIASDQLANEHGLANLYGAAFDSRLKKLEVDKKISAEEAALLRGRRDNFKLEENAVELTNLRLQKEKLVTNAVGLTGAALNGVGTILSKLGISGLDGEIQDISTKIKDNMRKELERTRTVLVSGGSAFKDMATGATTTAAQARELYNQAEKEKKAQQEIVDKLETKGDLSQEELKQLEDAKKARQEQVDIQQDLVDKHKLQVEVQYESLGLMTKMKHLAGGALDAIGKGLDKLADPAVIFGFITSSLGRLNSETVKLQKATGISAKAARQLRGEITESAKAFGPAFITSDKLVKSFLSMSEYIGQSAHMLGGEALKSATYLTEKMHLSADAAGQLVTMTRLTGRNTEETFKGMGKTLTTFNLTNKTAFSLKDIMNDIGNMSKATVLTLGKSPDALVKAAAAARKLGVSMEQLESIGESLLDFESSIEKELEAQLLTGNSLNLSRARELAMMGDMEGLANEIGNQEAIKNAFATKNVIAQKAAAEALGMSRDELAKMTYQQELNSLGAEKFKAIYGDVAYESAKAQSAQDKFKDLIAKTQDILANMLTPLLPIVEIIGKIAASPIAAPILAAVVAMKALGGSVAGTIKGVGSLVGKMSELSKGGVVKGIRDKATGLKDKAVSLFKQGKDGIKDPVAKTMDKGNELTGKVKDKTKGANAAQGPGGFLKSLAEGLREMGTDFGKIMKGTLALGLAAVAVVGPFALALRTIKDVDPAVIAAFSLGVGVLGGSLALLGKMSGNVIKGGIALAAAGAGILAASFGFSLLEGINPDVVKAVVGSLLVLGTGAALLGALSGNIITGAAALGILGLAMIPAAFALSLLENVDTSKIVAFSIALPLLGLAAAGLGFLSPFIMAGAAALAVLGAAMIPAAIAFNIMAKADLEKIGTGLTAIASVGPQLALAGAGMVALAGGAAVLGLASPALLLAGGALTVLGMAAQLASNANIEGIANQLTQLGGIGPGLVAAGMGLFAIAGGLTAFALAMAGASVVSGLTSLFGGGVMGDLEALAAMAGPLSQVGVSLTAIASGLAGIALALSTLETEKINELKGLVMTTAFAAPMVAATGAITDLISGITGGGDEGSSNAALEAKLDELIAVVKQGGNVYIDGNKAGTAMMLAQYKTA